MSIFSALFDQGKIYNFQQAFGVKDITTAEMQAAIRDWAQLYYQAEATPEEDPCQRIPVLVVSTITRAVFSEYQADSDNEDAKRILLELGRVKGKAVQQALIGGQSFLKPIFGADGLAFSVIPRGSYLPLGRNERDEITDIGTAERTTEGGKTLHPPGTPPGGLCRESGDREQAVPKRRWTDPWRAGAA